MLYLYLTGLIGLSLTVFSEREPNPSGCKDKCGPAKCNKWKKDNHPCAARKIDQGIAIDPWRIGDDRCHETSCDQCGGFDFCVERCENQLTDMRAAGYVLGDFPNCNEECSAAADPDYMCYMDDSFPAMGEHGRPICYHLWQCLKAYCSAVGPEHCYARENIVDPWNVLADDDCKTVNCRWCGNHQDCLNGCNKYNNRKFNKDKVNCAEECRAVKGFKCLMLPTRSLDGEDEEVEENLIADESASLSIVGKTTPKSTLNHYRFPICFSLIASLSVGIYIYRRPSNKYVPIE